MDLWTVFGFMDSFWFSMLLIFFGIRHWPQDDFHLRQTIWHLLVDECNREGEKIRVADVIHLATMGLKEAWPFRDDRVAQQAVCDKGVDPWGFNDIQSSQLWKGIKTMGDIQGSQLWKGIKTRTQPLQRF